ncbi:MAG: helix-turn-helix transcriptional regulator [Terriglobia bacterium]
MANRLEYSARISALRTHLGKTQKEFALLVGVTQQAVSDWESDAGASTPSTESLLRLGALAGYPDCLWFWEQAGMDQEAGLSQYTKLSQARGELALSQSTLVAPYRKKGEASPKTEDFDPWPTKYIPDPSSVGYWRIDHRAGQISALGDGTIIVLDLSDNDATDLMPFWDRVILVESTGEASAHSPALSPGIHMGRLRIKAWAGTSLDYMSYLAVLWPLQGELRWTSPPPGLCIGSGTSGTKWRLRRPGIEIGHPHAHVVAEAQAREDSRCFPGCTVLGRVLWWFRPPSTSGK